MNDKFLTTLFVHNTGLTITTIFLLPIFIGFIVAQYKKRNNGDIQQELNIKTLLWSLFKEVLWLGVFAFAYMVAIFGGISSGSAAHQLSGILEIIGFIFYVSVYTNYIWGVYHHMLGKQLPHYRKFVILGIFALLFIVAAISWNQL